MHTPTILVVEDDAALRMALTEKLTHEGFVVVEASNGEEGLAMAKEHSPALILLDVLMPGIDGLTMLKTLRSEEWGKGLKVVMLTNQEDPNSVADSLEQGAFDYLVKSDWKLEDVVEKIHTILGTA